MSSRSNNLIEIVEEDEDDQLLMTQPSLMADFHEWKTQKKEKVTVPSQIIEQTPVDSTQLNIDWGSYTGEEIYEDPLEDELMVKQVEKEREAYLYGLFKEATDEEVNEIAKYAHDPFRMKYVAPVIKTEKVDWSVIEHELSILNCRLIKRDEDGNLLPTKNQKFVELTNDSRERMIQDAYDKEVRAGNIEIMKAPPKKNLQKDTIQTARQITKTRKTQRIGLCTRPCLELPLRYFVDGQKTNERGYEKVIGKRELKWIFKLGLK